MGGWMGQGEERGGGKKGKEGEKGRRERKEKKGREKKERKVSIGVIIYNIIQFRTILSSDRVATRFFNIIYT
jgi:hypothetical protein